MPRTKTTLPVPSRHKNQRSLDEPLYLIRPFFQNWTSPTWVTSEAWRNVVRSQQICLICRETLIGNILSLDWKIEPRDSTQRDELKTDIQYYTKFFEDTGDFDWSEFVEWVTADLLDLPFGSGIELGHEGDSELGRLLWIELLDGGTLYPTLNRDWPVAQYIPESGITPVVFPRHAINRVFMSPRTDIKRKGWGMAPPEKIWMALNLLSTGDSYYARLLLDTPDAGILDLIDMEKSSAEEWVKGWRDLLNGVDPQKIPVLYEHTTPAAWIPFTRNPADIQYDTAITRYTSILTAGYGLSPSDIGLSAGGQNGGNTMAGNLREERRSKKNGYARLKRKLEGFITRMLPPTLRFRFIDMDDELMVALGRARLANATAWGQMISANMFTEEEARNQTIADGMLSISVPEALPAEIKEKLDNKQAFMNQNPLGGNQKPERPSMLGRPVSPSSGGWGETAARSEVIREWIGSIVGSEDRYFQRLAYIAYPSVMADVRGISDALENPDDIGDWSERHNEALWSRSAIEELPELSQVVIQTVRSELVNELLNDAWWNSGNPSLVEEFLSIARGVWDRETEIMRHRSYVERTQSHEVVFEYDRVVSSVEEQVGKMLRCVPEMVSNSVIAALRDHAVESVYDQDRLETTYDPNLLSRVREYLENALIALADVFAHNTSGIIIEEFGKGT